MNRLLYLLTTLVLASASFYAGSIWGFRTAAFQSALAENKVAIMNLDSSPEMNPQLHEYLKARIYGNVLQFYPPDPGYLQARDWDRGPVNREILGEITAAKDPAGAA